MSEPIITTIIKTKDVYVVYEVKYSEKALNKTEQIKKIGFVSISGFMEDLSQCDLISGDKLY